MLRNFGRCVRRFQCLAIDALGSPVRARVFQRMASGQVSAKFQPSPRLHGVEKNVWVEFVGLVAKYNPVNLGQGFPDFAPPDYMVQALNEAAKKTMNHQYTRSQGHPRLVKVLAELYGKMQGRTIDPMTEIITSVGSYSSLFFSIQAFVHPGDEVIIIEPFFDCYVPMVKMAGGNLVYVPLRPKEDATSSRDWTLDPRELEAAFSAKTKMLIFNTPNNPLGKVFTRDELQLIADMCCKYDVMVVSDEVYEWLVYDDNEHIRIATLPGMWERTLSVGSAGKTFSLTGWKLGWSIGPSQFIKHLQTCNANTSFVAPTILQEAIAMGFELESGRLGQDTSYFTQLSKSCQEKRDRVLAVLKSLGMNPLKPEGGYFMMADVSKLGIKFDDTSDDAYDFKFCRWMTEHKKLSAIPPSAFFSTEHAYLAEKYIRFNFAKSDETVEAGIKILQDWGKEIKQ